jgi:hypothetical protein
MFKEKLLPNLNNNIVCGNSLIGIDILDGNLFNFDEEKKLKPMDFENVFPSIIKNGGFDAIVGNPPYLYSAGKNYGDYFTSHYEFHQYQTDYYVFFIERALKLIKNKGKFSYIISDSWLNSDYFKIMRDNLLLNHHIEQIVVFNFPVFSKVTLENSILFITVNEKPSFFDIVRYTSPQKYSITNNIESRTAYTEGLINPNKSLVIDSLIQKIEINSIPLIKYCKINRGIHAYRIDGYGKTKFGNGVQTKKDKELQSYHSDKKLDNTFLPEIKGKDVNQFTFEFSGRFLSYGDWLAEPRSPEYFFNPKIVLRKIIGEKIIGTYINEPLAIDQSLYILINESNDDTKLKTLLGLLTSRLAAWYVKNKYSIFDTLYPWFTIKQLSAFPVKISAANLYLIVDQLLASKQQLKQAKTDNEKNYLERKCETINKKIDESVFKLYNLTEEEIRIIENESTI